jgi:hypothetical protein
LSLAYFQFEPCLFPFLYFFKRTRSDLERLGTETKLRYTHGTTNTGEEPKT